MRYKSKESIYTHSFFLPNDIFDYQLSHRNFKVYSYLRKCSNKQHQCWPSRDDIAKKCGIRSRTTVDAAIRELIDEGLISKTARYSADGITRESNLYTLLDI